MLLVRASTEQVTDGELVEQVRGGNSAAFGELVERHQGAVYRAALAALGNTADAEDVAQEALVLAYRRLDQFRGDASVKTWMVSIAWRLSLTRRRRIIWKVRRMMGSDTELDGVRAPEPSPEGRMQMVELIASMREHIRGLPPKLRDALLLTAAGDLTQEEIAAALQIPAATFRGRVRDARLRLKQKLNKT
ncbi:MAG TPA: RNA polymerase sigma factor [Vicinamibacterales bacterium]|nr:RNA polymerase sigma factor [Vicinamibacterales bacterium]